ncbi:MAG: hypothetical protein JO257_07345 [Deltaproteobacteria bacterium]|nr:hypothetical protein [Deltaproteobacteria bacterium]
MAEPKLSPLACPRCGASVPLGEGPIARCTYCAIDVPVPAEYIALRDDAKTRVRDREQIDRLYAEASRPPSRFVRAFAKLGRIVTRIGLGAGALIVVATVIGVIVREQDGMTAAISALLMIVLVIPAFLETMFHLAGARSVDLVDAFGALAGVLPALAVWLLVVAPVLISSTCRGALASIIGLRMRLAAHQPVQPGGPATCRGCGAALDVPAGALGVRCTYCETDNVVAIPAMLAAADHREATHVHEAIDQVMARHQSELRAQRKDLRLQLVTTLIALIVAFEILYFPAHYFLDGTFTMARTPAGHRGILYPADVGNPTIAANATQPVELEFTWKCHNVRRRCIHFYVALERGERVTFETPQPDLQLALQRHQHLVLSVGVWEPWVTDASLAARAPYTGWYRVEASVPIGTESVTTSLRWSTSD